ncbi:MAG: hypothetical protein OHK0040_00470 [bacterium]
MAGPVVAAAVILPMDFFCPELRDSKKLKRKKICELAYFIKKSALSFGIGVVDSEFIDKNDILTATFLAMQKAVSHLSIKPDLLLIDGSQTNPFLKEFQQFAIVDGDDKIPLISAASIIAKDYRDSIMEQYALIYPDYCFEKHKGYGTPLHRSLIQKHGLSPIHRKSFCKWLKKFDEMRLI